MCSEIQESNSIPSISGIFKSVITTANSARFQNLQRFSSIRSGWNFKTFLLQTWLLKPAAYSTHHQLLKSFSWPVIIMLWYFNQDRLYHILFSCFKPDDKFCSMGEYWFHANISAMFFNIFWQMASPRPTPLSFVVKNGLKISFKSFLPIPLPVSRIVTLIASSASDSPRDVQKVRTRHVALIRSRWEPYSGLPA